jgi:hypothetical protein
MPEQFSPTFKVSGFYPWVLCFESRPRSWFSSVPHIISGLALQIKCHIHNIFTSCSGDSSVGIRMAYDLTFWGSIPGKGKVVFLLSHRVQTVLKPSNEYRGLFHRG